MQVLGKKYLWGHNARSQNKERGISIVRKIGKHKFPYFSEGGNLIKMRSSWEVRYAEFLDIQEIIWIYEPKMFKLSNGKRYLPDFYLPKTNEFHEVKGWMSPEAIEKIDLFKKEYPKEKLVLVDKCVMLELGLLQ